MEYNKIQVYGKLFAGNQIYWIVSPYPESLDSTWGQNVLAFFGVNTDNWKWGDKGSEYAGKQIFPVPYAIPVSGTWHIELRPTVGEGTILCEKPVLLEETDFEFTDDEEELELIGDIVRSDDYRFLNGEFEEEDWNDDEELEEAEIDEEEEVLVEEG